MNADDAHEIQRALAEEREACARIAEEALRQLTHGHGSDPYGVISSIVERIRARGRVGGAAEGG